MILNVWVDVVSRPRRPNDQAQSRRVKNGNLRKLGSDLQNDEDLRDISSACMLAFVLPVFVHGSSRRNVQPNPPIVRGKPFQTFMWMASTVRDGRAETFEEPTKHNMLAHSDTSVEQQKREYNGGTAVTARSSVTSLNENNENVTLRERRSWEESSQLGAVEELMRDFCIGGGDALGAMVWQHIAGGGKRFRARLALQAVQALGDRDTDGIAWAASCELLHNASLIHDDIQDGDRFRRGKEALWVRHGAAHAINAGDLCISLAFAVIGSVPTSDAQRWQLANLLACSTRRIVEGQAAEMRLLLTGAIPTWHDYASCVEGKTSALFSLPIEGAALIAGRSVEDAAALGDAFRPLGVLFQIQDDILDLYGKNGRDQSGSDIAQPGKATAFVVEHLHLHPKESNWLLPILLAPRAETTRAQIDAVITRFAEGGALDAIWRRIEAIQSALESSPVLARDPVLGSLATRFVREALLPVAHTRPDTR